MAFNDDEDWDINQSSFNSVEVFLKDGVDSLLSDGTDDALHVASKPSSPPIVDVASASNDMGPSFGATFVCRSMMDKTTNAEPTKKLPKEERKIKDHYRQEIMRHSHRKESYP